MQKRESLWRDSGNARLIDTDGLRAYTNLGRDSAVKLGDKIGARVQVGRRVLWDKAKLDKYFDEITEA